MKEIVHPDFAQRLERSCDGNPDVPPLNHGRLGWFVDGLEKHGVHVTIETIRKWFHGETRPRTKALRALAILLKVDEGWLASGRSPEFSETQRRLHSVVAGGVVNLVAGLIQIDGSHPAFPEEGDSEADDKKVNLYAIIRGAKYSFHVTPTVPDDEELHFLVPVASKGTVVLGVVREREGFSFRVFELDWETIEAKGTRKSTAFDVRLADHQWREITSFAERI